MRVRYFFLVLSLLFVVFSCNRYDKADYPQSAILHNYCKAIESCVSNNLEGDDAIPIIVREKAKRFLKSRMNPNTFKKTQLPSATIHLDETVLPNSEEEMKKDSLLFGYAMPKEIYENIDDCVNQEYSYPIYRLGFKLELLELGVEAIYLDLVVDNDLQIIHDIQFPSMQPNSFIPIDSVHSELIRRKIPSELVSIDLRYDETKKEIYWIAKSFDPNSPPTCLINLRYNYHFKMNFATGKIIDYPI